MYKLFMALRYLRAHKIIYFSIAGVGLGIMAIVLVTSIMSGFSRDMRARIRGMQAHIVVTPIERDKWIVDYESLAAEIAKIPLVTGCSPRVEYEAWMNRGTGYRDVHLVGIDPEREPRVSEIGAYFRKGGKDRFDFEHEFGKPRERPGAVLGVENRRGGSVNLLTAKADVFPIICNQEFELVGYFSSGMAEYDSSYLFMHLKDAQDFLKLSATEEQRATVNVLAVGVDDYERNGRAVREAILARLHERRPCRDDSWHAMGQCGMYKTTTWEQARRILLSAVEVEKGLQLIIMFLIVIVACFNIASIYTLVVRAKTRDIGILRALGASEEGVTFIFLISGGLCGLIGSAFGIVLGLLLSFNLNAICDFVRVASREMNGMPRGELAAAEISLALALLGFLWTWGAFYRERRPTPWVRMVLTTVFLGAAAWLATGWVPEYKPFDRYDADLPPGFRMSFLASVSGGWVAHLAAWRFLDRWRQRPSWIFFGFGGTVVWIAFLLAILATGTIATSILLTHPGPGWPGLELFPRQIYYLDRVPVYVDSTTISVIVGMTLVVSVIFSIYPALRAAAANPVEVMRDE